MKKMKRNIILAIAFFAISCSNAETKESVKEKVGKVVPTVKEEIIESVEKVKVPVEEKVSDALENSKLVQGIVEETITEVVEEKSVAIKEAISTKVKEVVTDVIPSKLEEDKEVKDVKEVIEVKEVHAFSHATFDALLKKYVSASGTVNYAGLKTQRAVLDRYIATFKAQGIVSSWSRNEKLAYYINAYNAYTIQLILNNYPTTSIMKINDGKAWDLQVVNLGGKVMSLNHLENKIIRPVFKEPRIHFAVNCAAVSCPKLMNGAFLPSQLNSQLDRQTKAFINNTKENQVSANTVKISQIFEWYAVDFGEIKTYINKYATTKAGANATVTYNTYKWELNGK